MAFKEGSSSDDVCGGVWARQGARRSLVHRVTERLDVPATLSAVRTLTAAYPKAMLTLVETMTKWT